MSSPANQVGYKQHQHTDVQAVAPPPPQVFDDALTVLAAELRKVKLTSGTLDVGGLVAAIRPGLQAIKPPERLELVSSASCNVVDPQDLGGYWSGPYVSFAHGSKDHVLRKSLEGNWPVFSLAKLPEAELIYSLTGGGFDENAVQPFRRTVRLSTDYYITVKVTVTFDPAAITRDTQPVATGIASRSPQDPTLRSALSLTDRGN